jgi:hypothetical protein
MTPTKQRRNSLGRFSAAIEEGLREDEAGFFQQEGMFYSRILSVAYRLIPAVIFIIFVCKSLKFKKYFFDFLIEVSCGDGCTCSCSVSGSEVLEKASSKTKGDI